jgi:signal transduction histidine kinase
MSRDRAAQEPRGFKGGTSPGQHRSSGGQAAALRLARAGGVRRGRQRSIRSTLSVLLIIPLVSLIALWAYAAANTVGGAIAKRDADTINKDMGTSTHVFMQQLITERADTFAWQSAQGALSLTPKAQRPRLEAVVAALRKSLEAQREHTDTAATSFRAGAAAAAGDLAAASKPVTAALVRRLDQLGPIRSAVDAGTMAPLAAFQAYNGITDAFFTFFRGGLTNPDSSIATYAEGEGAVDEGQAVEYIGREATLAGGAMAAGGVMSQAEHQLFVQAIGARLLVQQAGVSPLYWQGYTDPYPRVLASRAYATFETLESRIAATAPGTPVPVSPLAWESAVLSVVGAFDNAEALVLEQATKGAAHEGDVILLRLFVVGGAGLLAVVLSALLLLGFGNRITRELTGFRRAVRALADERLPALVSRLRQGEDVDVAAEAPPLELRTRTREITETAEAFSVVQRTAVEAAVGQADLRKGVSKVFRSLARRNQSLLQRQLKMLDGMERGTHDPEALAQLFQLDHRTPRLRRQADGLIILSGAAPGRGWRQPVPLVEVLRGAIGEIQDYPRVDLVTESRDVMLGTAVADVTHLLAELVENAVLYSPPHTHVEVKASRVANGHVVEVEDRGLGIPAVVLAELNQRLARPPEFDLADSDQLGLFVVSRLAARHQIKVSLRGSPYGGTAAIVLMPHHLVMAAQDAAVPAGQHAAPAGQHIHATPAGQHIGLASRSTSPATARPVSDPATVPLISGPDAGLPRRLRQASLAPQLREPGSPGQAPAADGQPESRSADQARTLISSIQQGWRDGRAAADQPNGTAGGSPNGSPGGDPGSRATPDEAGR